MPELDRLAALQEKINQFVLERDWAQFHSPKNLAMAMIVESAELVEHFQWLTEQQSRELPVEKIEAVSQEMADTFVYLLRLASVLNVDIIDAANRKMAINELKYPAEKARGRSDKYTAYE